MEEWNQRREAHLPKLVVLPQLDCRNKWLTLLMMISTMRLSLSLRKHKLENKLPLRRSPRVTNLPNKIYHRMSRMQAFRKECHKKRYLQLLWREEQLFLLREKKIHPIIQLNRAETNLNSKVRYQSLPELKILTSSKNLQI